MDTQERFSPLTLLLHWLIAFGIIGLCAVGLYMVRTESWHLFDLHKSFGMLVFAAAVLRLLWRWKNGLPVPVRPLNRFEHGAALWMHRLLLACTVLMPLTGMLYSGASGHGFGVFSLELFPANPAHDASGEVLPFNAGLAELGENLHDALGYVLLALVAVHAAAALKHHLIDRDDTLRRMLGRSASGAGRIE